MNAYPAFDGTQSCAGHDTEKFFADTAGNAVGKNADAKKVCKSGCPFLTPCYNYALTHAVEGVWGGTTAYERKNIRERLGIVATPLTLGDFGVRRPFAHGTSAGYARHRRLYEKPCGQCRIAESERIARRKRGRAS